MISLWRDDRPTRGKLLDDDEWVAVLSVRRETPLGDVSKKNLQATTTIIHARGCHGSVVS